MFHTIKQTRHRMPSREVDRKNAKTMVMWPLATSLSPSLLIPPPPSPRRQGRLVTLHQPHQAEEIFCFGMFPEMGKEEEEWTILFWWWKCFQPTSSSFHESLPHFPNITMGHSGGRPTIPLKVSLLPESSQTTRPTSPMTHRVCMCVCDLGNTLLSPPTQIHVWVQQGGALLLHEAS